MSGHGSSPSDSPPERQSARLRSEASRARRRERNRLAQQRYRRIARDVQENADTSIESLTAEILNIQFENEGLVNQERRLWSVLRMQHSHMSALHSHEEAWKIEQRLLLSKVVLLLSEVQDRNITTEEAMTFTFEDWVGGHYEDFLSSLAELWATLQQHPGGETAQKLHDIVMLQRTSEIELGMHSGINLALLAWNLDNAAHIPGSQQPSSEDWGAALRQLNLSADQVQRLLQARSSMMEGLQDAQEAREASYVCLQAAAEDITTERSDLAEAGISEHAVRAALMADEAYRDAVRQLHAALWDERRAIQVYLDIVFLYVLTPAQEAWLDAVSPTRPWFPDWWTMGNLLAAQHNMPQAPDFQVLQQPPPDHLYLPSMPIFMPLQLFLTPCTVLGGGANLKRTTLTCAFLTVERCPKFGDHFGGKLLQLPDIQLLRHLTLYEVMAAKYTETWQPANAQEHLVP